MCNNACLVFGQGRNIPKLITIILITKYHNYYFRPGGELMPGEDENEGLKRAMTEVKWMSSQPILQCTF